MGRLTALLALTLSPAPPPVLPPGTSPLPPPASSHETQTQRYLLRVPNFSFARTSTLRILDEGRRGTWSLVASSIGGGYCPTTTGTRCLDIAIAQVGIAWRPHGSFVSLFAAGGIVSDVGIPAAVRRSPIAFQLTSGVQVDVAGLLDRALARARR